MYVLFLGMSPAVRSTLAPCEIFLAGRHLSDTKKRPLARSFFQWINSGAMLMPLFKRSTFEMFTHPPELKTLSFSGCDTTGGDVPRV